MSLDEKVNLTNVKIREFYNFCKGDIYVGFSGGKDSTVLLDIVRKQYPNTKAVFVDTGLEYPEIKEFVKTIDNVEMVRPNKTFKQVIDEYGYPIVSKTISMAISRYRNTKSDVQKELRMWGGINPTSGKKQSTGVISQKWHFLIDAPFKISERCCDILKKNPLHKFEKQSGLKPIIGIMASDSMPRRKMYLKNGCNMFDNKTPMSAPLGFWLEKDVWEYIKVNNLPYCKIYDTGVDRTGCMFCLFGVQHETAPNRFQIMKTTHPVLYNYCINKLNLKVPLEYIGVKYE